MAMIVVCWRGKEGHWREHGVLFFILDCFQRSKIFVVSCGILLLHQVLDHLWGVVLRSGLFSEILDRFISLEVFVADEVLSILDVYVGKNDTFCGDLRCVGEKEDW